MLQSFDLIVILYCYLCNDDDDADKLEQNGAQADVFSWLPECLQSMTYLREFSLKTSNVSARARVFEVDDRIHIYADVQALISKYIRAFQWEASYRKAFMCESKHHTNLYIADSQHLASQKSCKKPRGLHTRDPIEKGSNIYESVNSISVTVIALQVKPSTSLVAEITLRLVNENQILRHEGIFKWEEWYMNDITDYEDKTFPKYLMFCMASCDYSFGMIANVGNDGSYGDNTKSTRSLIKSDGNVLFTIEERPHPLVNTCEERDKSKLSSIYCVALTSNIDIDAYCEILLEKGYGKGNNAPIYVNPIKVSVDQEGIIYYMYTYIH